MDCAQSAREPGHATGTATALIQPSSHTSHHSLGVGADLKKKSPFAFNVDDQLPAQCPRDASLPALWMVADEPTDAWTPMNEPYTVRSAIQMVGGGGASSNGAFRVHLTTDTDTYDLVIKPSSGAKDSAAGEEVASRLALALGLITTPVRALPSKCHVIHSLLLRCKYVPIEGDGDIQYLQGIIAGSIPKRSHVLVQGFLTNDGSAAKLKQHLHTPRVWYQLGGICALDALLNNFDRLPFVHRNAGNITNILVRDAECTIELLPIDQQLFVMVGAAFEKYTTALAELLDGSELWDEGLRRLCFVLGVKEKASVDCACRNAFHDSFIDVFDRFVDINLDSLTARLDKSLEEEVPRIREYLSAMQEFVIKYKS